MGSTTLYGLRYPDPGVGANGPAAFKNLADDIASRLHRAEPLTGAQITAIASPRIGQIVTNTDTGRVLYWNGSIWRPVGGGASGTASVGAMTLTTTYQTLAWFIGLGFEEISFTLTSGSGRGFQGTAVADPGRAQGLAISNNTTGTVLLFAPSSASDAGVPFGLSINNSSIFIRNLRLDADGYLRFELAASSNTGVGTVDASTKLNWRAR
jgi:hypothetical protein